MFAWWRRRKEAQAALAAQAAHAQHALYVQPPSINPDAHCHLAFAQWRADHIKRWLDDPANVAEPFARRNHLEAERDMYLSMLRGGGHDV